MMKAKKFVLVKHFALEPKLGDLQLQEETLRVVQEGEILVEALWWSVDPYMRSFAAAYPVGGTMFGSQVGKIVESKATDFPVGSYIVGYFGWRTHTVHDPTTSPLPGFPDPYLLPDFKGLPYSLALGALGMPGNAAYFGFLEICQPKPGETVVVTSAAGCVGSTVGQIAKIKGCRVLGFTGTDEKVKWLTEELGFDAAYNYKKKDVAEALKEAAPRGVDCYYDNVGGKISNAVIKRMNEGGRIAVSGSISTYNSTKIPERPIVPKKVHRQEFSVHRWLDRWTEGINANFQWILEGRMKYRETITEGFENMPKAFIGLFKGENIGKAIVKPYPEAKK